jgi:hypothetical protein
MVCDKDINVHNPHTVTKLKMVSLYDFMLDPFKNKGHCVVMDSAYMSDAMCQIGRKEWGINRIPVMAPILAPLFGVHFLLGCFSLKNWTYCPVLRVRATPFKSTCLLTRLKEANIDLSRITDIGMSPYYLHMEELAFSTLTRGAESNPAHVLSPEV